MTPQGFVFLFRTTFVGVGALVGSTIALALGERNVTGCAFAGALIGIVAGISILHSARTEAVNS